MRSVKAGHFTDNTLVDLRVTPAADQEPDHEHAETRAHAQPRVARSQWVGPQVRRRFHKRTLRPERLQLDDAYCPV